MKQTLRLSGGKPEDLQKAAALLRDGGLVAIPTETVYGLAADALITADRAEKLQAAGDN